MRLAGRTCVPLADIPRRGRRSGALTDAKSLEQESRGLRLFLGRLRKRGVKAVTGGPPRVHVHLLMHLHMNRVMIRVS